MTPPAAAPPAAELLPDAEVAAATTMVVEPTVKGAFASDTAPGGMDAAKAEAPSEVSAPSDATDARSAGAESAWDESMAVMFSTMASVGVCGRKKWIMGWGG
jgi:hypothetical protein